MSDAIVLSHIDDVSLAGALSERLNFCPIFVFDPTLLDHVIGARLKNVQFIPFETSVNAAEYTKQAHVDATEVETHLDIALQKVLPGLSLYSWQHLRWYYFFLTVSWYREHWHKSLPLLRKYTLHIPCSDQVQIYYFNSFLPTQLLSNLANEANIPCRFYPYPSTPPKPALVPGLNGLATEPDNGFVLTHIPTCFYDIGYFNKILEDSRQTIINFESPYFDLPTHHQRSVPLVALQNAVALRPADITETIIPFANCISGPIRTVVTGLLGNNALALEQADYISTHYVSQMLTLLNLQHHFQNSKPSKLLLSDHDTGLHGPFVRFAQSHNIPVILLPHSKVTHDLWYLHPNITAFTHPIQGDVILNGAKSPIPHLPIDFLDAAPVNLILKSGLKKLGILLTALSVNGIYLGNYNHYIQGLKRFTLWCQQNNLELEIRCKPNYTLFFVLSQELGIPIPYLMANTAKPMKDFIHDCDVCVMYDNPTSAAIEFLENSIPIMLCHNEELMKAMRVIGSKELIPRLSVSQTISRLSEFITQPDSLSQFQRDQTALYNALKQSAQPLSTLLAKADRAKA